jgi:hypothetical protein
MLLALSEHATLVIATPDAGSITRTKQIERREAKKELGSTDKAREGHGLVRCCARAAAAFAPSIQKCSERNLTCPTTPMPTSQPCNCAATATCCGAAETVRRRALFATWSRPRRIYCQT